MNSDSSLDDIHWLIGPEAAAILERLHASGGSSVGAVRELKRSHSDARVHLLLEQVELRRRATAKFPQADRMFFLPQPLQQATDLYVARYKAARFPAARPVADLCCGIGGDSIALAERGPVTGIDLEPATVLLAEANLRTLAGDGEDASEAVFRAEDVAQVSVASFSAWHLDPDRRASGRRTTQLIHYSPGPETIDRLLAECPHGAIKLAPATIAPESWAQQAELEWIGRDRQCRQQVAWFGDLAQAAGARRATVVEAPSDGVPRAATFSGSPGAHPPLVGQAGRYVFEPDAAVLAADLGGALAEHHGLAALHWDVPYFTSDATVDDLLMASFEVADVLPFDRKRLRRLFRERGVGRLEIKTRGVKESPEQIRRDLRLQGSEEAVLFLARLGRRVTAMVARRIHREP